MFDTLLIANRGEIACRVIRTARRMGLRTVAVYSDADAGARHVRDADLAVRLGPAPPRESYLSIERVLAAADRSGAQAVHPGYGFLSENAGFAAACADAGLVFVGPPVHAVQVMGDKIRAKQTVSAAGVPVVPGRSEPGLTDDDLVAAAAEVGYPVLVKPSAGGGGKGMRLVGDPAGLREALEGARREAAGAFGDDTLFLERFVERPRHIEVQVLADLHGHVVHLGERECSLQRRHQKVIEEAPSPLLDAATRERIGAAAVATARSVDYAGAGTVEFIVAAARPDEFFFMEMNTRLQVEHPVTELVTGLDLVEWQLRVAAGEPLGFAQDEVRLAGHAVEARVYAEDPARGFLPTGGKVLLLREPSGPAVRVDSGLAEGGTVGTAYDPMLSKVIGHGADRAQALAALDRALAQTTILGVTTNIGFLRALLAHPRVQSGELDTALLEGALAELVSAEIPPAAYAGYAALRLHQLRSRGSDPWDALTGWRLLGRAPLRLDVVGPDGRRVTATADGDAPDPDVSGHELLLALDGRTTTLRWALDGDAVWIGIEGGAWPLRPAPPLHPRGEEREVDTDIRSPLPGTVVAVHVADGAAVEPGDPVLVVEAMKMEHVLRAPVKGSITLHTATGEQVAVDQLLAEVGADVGADVPAAATLHPHGKETT